MTSSPDIYEKLFAEINQEQFEEGRELFKDPHELYNLMMNCDLCDLCDLCDRPIRDQYFSVNTKFITKFCENNFMTITVTDKIIVNSPKALIVVSGEFTPQSKMVVIEPNEMISEEMFRLSEKKCSY